MTTDVLAELGITLISLPTPFPVGPVNVYLIKSDPPILFDTGLKTEETYDLLSNALSEEGYTFGDLGSLVVTHAHRDHMGLVGQLQEETGAPIYGHPDVKAHGEDTTEGGKAQRQFYLDIMHEFGVGEAIIEEANSLFDRFRSFSKPYTVNHVVEDGGEILGYRTHFVPGHSSSDTLFVHEASGYTIVGDHILESTNPNPLLRRPAPGATRAKSLVEYQASLRKSRDLELGLCLPGHGDPFDDHVSAVDKILSRHEIRAKQVLKQIDAGASTPYAVSSRLFPQLENRHLHLGLSISVGHMEVLEEHGVLRSEHRDGILHFERS